MIKRVKTKRTETEFETRFIQSKILDNCGNPPCLTARGDSRGLWLDVRVVGTKAAKRAFLDIDGVKKLRTTCDEYLNKYDI